MTYNSYVVRSYRHAKREKKFPNRSENVHLNLVTREIDLPATGGLQSYLLYALNYSDNREDVKGGLYRHR